MKCPEWCSKAGTHDLHLGRGVRAGDVDVRLVLDDSWDKPRIYLGHYRVPGDQSSVMFPLCEAEDMAKLMAHLGHEDIAALIRETVRGA